MEVVETLQTKIAPEVFTTRVVYDGRKNIFSTRLLQFPSGSESQEVYPFAYLKVFIYFQVLTSSIEQFTFSLSEGGQAAKGGQATDLEGDRTTEEDQATEGGTEDDQGPESRQGSDVAAPGQHRGPNRYKVKLTYVATINPE